MTSTTATSPELANAIRRTNKLLAMAEDGRGNAAEALSAGNMAKNLMAKYGFNRTDLKAAEDQASGETKRKADVFTRAAQAFDQQFYAAQAAKAQAAKFAQAQAQAARAAAEKIARESFAAKAAAATAGRDKKVAPRAAAAKASVGAGGVRSTVTVDGVTYPSLRFAFLALGLPLGQHIKFRGQLKAAGTLKFGPYVFVNNA